MLASGLPDDTYVVVASITISLLMVLLAQVLPPRGIQKPPVREVTQKHRSESITSNSSTLVDTDEADAVKKDMSEQPKLKSHRISFVTEIPFKKLNLSIRLGNKSIKPKFSRRVSLPARRLSMHIVTAFNNITPHRRRSQENTDSYFPNDKASGNPGDANVATNSVVHSDKPGNGASKPIIVSVTQSTKVENVEGDKTNVKQTETHISVGAPRKISPFKRFVRRAFVAFEDIHLRKNP